MEDSGLRWRTAARYGGQRPEMEDSGPRWRTAARDGGQRPEMEDSGPILRTAARYGGQWMKVTHKVIEPYSHPDPLNQGRVRMGQTLLTHHR